jgi:hypothetical protein
MKQEELQLTGANFKGTRRELDYYPTPPECTIALMNFLSKNVEIFKSPCAIWEPACGELQYRVK